MNPLQQAAISYAARGWKVIPLFSIKGGRCDCMRDACKSPGKHPRTLHGLKDASDDAEKITEWWTLFPDANIGVLAGESGILVLDIDPRNGGLESASELAKTYGKLPDTPVAKTGGGGAHYFFRCPPKARNVTGIRPGVDVKAMGGYFVAPPSNHISGNTYEWIKEPDATPVADPPGWITSKTMGPTGSVMVSPAETIMEGSRGNTLLSFGGTMRRRGMGYESILSALAAENARCAPPLEASEVEDLARRAASYDPAVAEASIEREIRSRAPWAEVLKADIIPATALSPYVDCEIPYVINPIAVRGMLTEVVGVPKGGKSAFSLYLALCAAMGKWDFPDLLHASAPVRVLYVAYEDPKIMMAKRMSFYMAGLGFEPKTFPVNLSFMFKPEIWLDREGYADAVISMVKETASELVIFDTLSYIHRSNEIDNSEMVVPMSNLTKVAEDGNVAGMYIHHAAKGSSNRLTIEKGRGAGAIQAAAHIIVDWAARERGVNTNEVTIQSKFEHKEISWLVDYEHTPKLGEDSPERVRWAISQPQIQNDGQSVSGRMRDALHGLEILMPAHPSGVSKQDLGAHLGIMPDTAKDLLEMLISKGLVMRVLTGIGRGNKSLFKPTPQTSGEE